MIQSVLGSANITMDAEMQKNKVQYNMELSQVFKHASRLIRCIVDCKISLGDSVSVNHALMLDRSLAARAWDDSPMQMKQIEEVGIASIMKFVNAGIRSMEDLESTAAHKIETLMSRNPPFGLKILDRLKMFPKLRVSLHILPNSVSHFSCSLGFILTLSSDH
jgi:ATP-dependent DNA helicase HFM1/MER3